MSNNLRSLLGMSRVQKKKKSKSTTTRPRTSSSSSPSSSSWTSLLPRIKPTAPSTKPTSLLPPQHNAPSNSSTSTTTPTRPPSSASTIRQTHALILTHMFDPIPPRASGLNSTRTAAVLATRAAVPPLVSVAHLQAVLGRSPTAVEREVAELVGRGVVRRVVVPERGGRRGQVVGDLLVLGRDLKGMVEGNGEGEGDGGQGMGLDRETRGRFGEWLRGHPGAQMMMMGGGGDGGLTRSQLDALVRAGFLTAVLSDRTGTGRGVYARPEDRSTMISLEAVSRAAAGSIAAVGGENALHSAGGTGGGGTRNGDGVGSGGGLACFSVAVPGTGVFLKLVSGALERLEELLERAEYREMPEGDLREKWDGGIAGDREAALAKKSRGEFVGILPGRTKKWKDFAGLSFDFVLQEAVGAGLVEVFETGSVGRGVRLLV